MSTISEERAKEKREKILAAGKGGVGEPTVSMENYSIDLTKALCWYNAYEDDKTKRKWVKSYVEKHGMAYEISIVSSEAPDYLFSKIGTIMRLRSRGQYVSEKHWNDMVGKFPSIEKYNKVKKIENEELEKKKGAKKVVDKSKIVADQCFDQINGVIDNFIETKKNVSFNLKNYFTANNVPTPVIKTIEEDLQKISRELNEIDYVDHENQLGEGYSNFSRGEMKRFQALVTEMINACKDKVVNERKPRKKRAQKVTPTSVLVSKIQYLKTAMIGGVELKSISPESIIGAKELWVYDVERRKISVYRSETGLNVNRTKILFDDEKSFGRKVRNPENFFTTSLAKKAINDSFQKLSTVEGKCNPGLNPNTIILRAY